MSRVVLAMSGGVDSSASAWLLQQQGHEVIGLFMRSGAAEPEVCSTKPGLLPIVSAKSHKQGCCSASDAADARRVADALDISFHALNFSEAFGQIKDYFADEYLAGRTPNPCVMCNVWLKFGKLWDFAEQVGADYIATGHYAQLRTMPGEAQPGLFRGLDEGKDQSYVLFGIRRELLDKILFPVGGYQKEHLRELARQAGIRTANKPDSQEICFIPDNDYGRFLNDYRGEQDTAGELVDTAGNVVGQHQGYQHFTIGQRRGLGVTFGEPRFVVRIEPDTHRVVLGNKQDLGRSTLEANRLNWLADVTFPFRGTAQIRYQHTPGACEVTMVGEDRMQVTFDDPQFGVAPGQAVAIYDGDRILGGGWIL
ncbi:tRNA 2-thiouridine(34) synthase MnmA [Planctomicrobium piriforme]|uniref:tRNA-specific 2-thiouridylase MnmA n=1 Tax=Planctomicrobium piriforme TaxID=1576369 RepID=A0A1I3MW50_9PLAN|nr:tRNA 2-thiouridine(34) synthase MnmA [Planctomicrobium piriforme]SFJ01217.1 tRNA-specific 2-thiouridylase [Planctomicrobium piriforme]